VNNEQLQQGYAEQAVKLASFSNRAAVKQGEAAMAQREKLITELREAGASQEQIDKLGLQ